LFDENDKTIQAALRSSVELQNYTVGDALYKKSAWGSTVFASYSRKDVGFFSISLFMIPGIHTFIRREEVSNLTRKPSRMKSPRFGRLWRMRERSAAK
jgi:hypothetical protein